MGLSMKLVFTLIIQLCPCFAACEVSKACYGTQGPQLECTRHNLRCSSGRISIQKAFYMDFTSCPFTGVSACRNVHLRRIQTTDARYNLSHAELDSLYTNCSTQPRCSFPAGRDHSVGFSAIVYTCIKETINMCNVTNLKKTDTSILWRGPSDQNTCACSITKPSSGEQVLLTLTALEIRHNCSNITVSVDGVTRPQQCLRITSHRLFLNSTNWTDVTLTVITTNNSAVIWIGIKGTANLNIACNESPATETASSVESTRTTLTWMTSTQELIGASSSFRPLRSSSVLPQDQTTTKNIGSEIDSTNTNVAIYDKDTRGPDTDGTTSPNATIDKNANVHKDAEITTGTVVGIIVPLCIIIAGVVTAVIIFLRRKLRQKSENGKVVKPEPNPQEVYSLEKKFSPEYDYATTNEYLDVVPQTPTMRPPQYVSARNISKIGKESQQARKGSSDYDYTGSNTYHVLERQSALGDSSDYDYAGGNDYHEVEPQESNTSDYDYATCGDKQANHPSSRNTQTRDSDYDHFGRQPARANDHHDTSLSVAGTLEGSNANEEVYSYNHLNEKAVSNINADSTYNTTSSTRHKMDSSTNDMEDHYGYNHLGTESKKNLPQNEYDTTASAIRDLARMNGDMEDSMYDHAHLLTSDSSPSGMTNVGFQESDYDHASTTTAHKDESESNASPNRSHQEERVADVYTLAVEADTNPYQLAK